MNYKKVISKHDFIVTEKTQGLKENPFFGNGTIGSNIGFEGDDFVIDLGREDLYEHRDPAKDGWCAYSNYRIPLGKLYLKGLSPMIAYEGRLSLYDAFFTGEGKSANGSVKLSHYVHADQMLFVTTIKTEGKEKLPTICYAPQKAASTRPGALFTEEDRQNYMNLYGTAYKDSLELYTPNPDPEWKTIDGIYMSYQSLLSGGSYAVAWKEVLHSRNEMTIYLTIENVYPDKNADELAAQTIKEAIQRDENALLESHKNWWHSYYGQSGIELEDQDLEYFYWMQIYKYGCITRPDRCLIDTAAIWFQPSPWPYVTNDLNTQMSYIGLYSSNRMNMAEPLLRTIKENMHHLIENVRPIEWQVDSASIGLATDNRLVGARDADMRYYEYTGDLMWLLHCVWKHYRHTMDVEILEEILQPILKRAVCYYFHMLEEDEKGVLHLPRTGSPEYEFTRDCNYDLSLLRFGCETYLKISELLEFEDEVCIRCKDTLNRLTDYPMDSSGLRIGRDVALHSMHRHFSHMLCIYPLKMMTGKEKEEYDLILKSVNHFMSFPDHSCMYPVVAAASIHAMLGNGERVRQYLRNAIRLPKVYRNTMYIEAGPCIESPLMVVDAMNDMMVQYVDDIIYIFPALDEALHYGSFENLSTEGGYIVSSSKKDGKIESIEVETKCHAVVRICADITDFVVNMPYTIEGNLLVVSMKAGEKVRIEQNKC